MKKIITSVFLFFVLISFVYAGTLGPGPMDQFGKILSGWNNMGGGWWHNGSYYSNNSGTIQAYTSNEFGALMNTSSAVSIAGLEDSVSGCTGFEVKTACHPEWAEALANCVSGSLSPSGNMCTPSNVNTQKVTQVVSVCSSTNMSGPCRPARVNSYASSYVAKKAETIGRSQGYTVSCTVEKLGFGGIGTDTNTNLDYYYNNLCTVNGSTGHSAEILADTSNWSSLSFTNTTTGNNSSGQNQNQTTGGGAQTGGVSTGQTAAIPINYSNPKVTNQMTDYITSALNKALSQLQNLQNQLNMELIQSGVISSSQTATETTSTVPVINLTLGDGLKNATYSVGDSIVYKVTMENVDSVNSYYNTIPKDSCVGGSVSGEQKSWIVRATAPLSVFNAPVEACQAGATYVISVVGTNKKSGLIDASSISVYIRP